MDSPPLHVDRVDVRQTDDELTLILGAAGVHVMLIRGPRHRLKILTARRRSCRNVRPRADVKGAPEREGGGRGG
ncbi:hypothetical protein [Dactylosporangium sp. NPDC049140]|uniref:hypothetical protein n=1 Tax=Dactylosporangium sp. NPDC049140 TaxID=3155647 RepID=UPI0033F01A73